MPSQVLLIQGHPDPKGGHLCHALAQAYADGATRAHSIKALERNILGFVGIAPIEETLIGLVEAMDDKARAKWLQKLRELGRQAR
jgi:putative NADPH-quinone reductase